MQSANAIRFFSGLDGLPGVEGLKGQKGVPGNDGLELTEAFRSSAKGNDLCY